MKFFILSLFIVTLSNFCHAFEVQKVRVHCDKVRRCAEVTSEFKALRRTYADENHFRQILKVYVANEGIHKFSYALSGERDKFKLDIRLLQKDVLSRIDAIKFVGPGRVEFPSILPIKEDNYLDETKLKQTQKLLTEIAVDKGYPDVTVDITKEEKSDGVIVGVKVELGRPILISQVNIVSSSKLLRNHLENVLGDFKKNVFDLQEIKSEIEETKETFVQYGYYLADIEVRAQSINKYKTAIFIEVNNSSFYTFFIQKNDHFSTNELKNFLTEAVLGYKRELSEEGIEQVVREYVESFGYKSLEISVKKQRRTNTTGELGVYYFIEIKPGRKVELSQINFRGNTFFLDKELKRIFYQEGSDQAKSDVLDEKYYEKFVNILRIKYIKQGFVSVSIDKPTIIFDSGSGKVNVGFRIREGIRSKIEEVYISGVSTKEKNSLRNIMVNKFEKFFDPIAFEEDLENIKAYLYSRGYFYAEIKNLNTLSLVTYSTDLSSVKLSIRIESGKKLFLGETIIIGNRTTRTRLILRELALKKGAIITRKKIARAQSALLSLGIFSQVQIKPIGGTSKKTDILVFVREKDFGSIEVAPGIRSDLGLKLSTLINYNNIDGLNKKITFRGSINRRINLNAIESSRRSREQNLIEYNTNVTFAENNILRGDLDFRSSLSFARERFFSFDADIRRFSMGVSSRVNKWFSWHTNYQLESISGYNTVPDNNGEDPNHAEFQIGSISPGVKLDFRDSQVGAKKGALFDLSVEFANPSFASQNSDDLKIDYYKVISRNKFYYSLSDNVVVAFSAAFGLQENLAKSKGYIPGIKVFRLSGADIIRGYEDDEMNRISQTNDDVSQFEVNSRAYMASLKFEPRYYYTDNLILGLFYDAGRVFVDRFEADKLRSSVGLSFKYLTPVGTLDFDYGIKLLRKEDSSGTLDSPGRVHVSIGFF